MRRWVGRKEEIPEEDEDDDANNFDLPFRTTYLLTHHGP